MKARQTFLAALLSVALTPLAACSQKSDSASTPISTSPQTSASAAGTRDNAACDGLAATLGAWGASFTDASGGLADAGGDVGKTQAVVDKVRAMNTKTASDLRAEAGKTADAAVKKVAVDLAVSLDKVNTQLDVRQIAQNPDKLTAIFDVPEYAAAAEAYEKVCGTA